MSRYRSWMRLRDAAAGLLAIVLGAGAVFVACGNGDRPAPASDGTGSQGDGAAPIVPAIPMLQSDAGGTDGCSTCGAAKCGSAFAGCAKDSSCSPCFTHFTQACFGETNFEATLGCVCQSCTECASECAGLACLRCTAKSCASETQACTADGVCSACLTSTTAPGCAGSALFVAVVRCSCEKCNGQGCSFSKCP